MQNIETQTDEEYIVNNDPDYYIDIRNLKVSRNNICIFYGGKINVSGNTQSTMTQYNDKIEYFLESFIQQLKDSGDF